MTDKAINIEQAIESIRCAFINVNNIKKGGTVFIDIVKLQLNDALKNLGEEDMLDI